MNAVKEFNKLAARIQIKVNTGSAFELISGDIHFYTEL